MTLKEAFERVSEYEAKKIASHNGDSLTFLAIELGLSIEQSESFLMAYHDYCAENGSDFDDFVMLCDHYKVDVDLFREPYQPEPKKVEVSAFDAIERFQSFAMGYPHNFIEEAWKNHPRMIEHYRNKFNGIHKLHGARAVMTVFWCELDTHNRKILVDYIMSRYND